MSDYPTFMLSADTDKNRYGLYPIYYRQGKMWRENIYGGLRGRGEYIFIRTLYHQVSCMITFGKILRTLYVVFLPKHSYLERVANKNVIPPIY